MTEGQVRHIMELRARVDKELQKFHQEYERYRPEIERVHKNFLKIEEAGISARFVGYCGALAADSLLTAVTLKEK